LVIGHWPLGFGHCLMLPPEQLAEIAELAGGFIHEIKNHVSTVNLNLQLLADDFADPQTPRERRAKQRIDRLQTQSQKLVDVSNDFLRFVRSQEIQAEPTPIEDVIAEMVDFVGPTAKAAGIDISVYAASGLPPVKLDRDLIKQALLNLLLNAEQAMPEGGQIVLQTRADGGDWVCLDVIDTGTGIDPTELPKLFRPFHTTKPGGTGLGLPTTKKIVRAHGGDVEVQSEPGRGTKFTIRLPVDRPAVVG
jgi:two-component system sensor histidine kinase HydH